MDTKETIHQFGTCTPARAEELRQALGLAMPIDTVGFCAQYYHNAAQRDPDADELQMLDALTITLESALEAYSPTDVRTNDSFVADTYADLSAKRRTLKPDATYPCTLGEMADLAGNYLTRVGKYLPLGHSALPIPEAMRDCVTSAGTHCVSNADAAFRLRILSTQASPVAAGDLLVLLSPAYEQTDADYQAEADRLLTLPEIGALVKAIYPIGQGGILQTLVPRLDGVQILLSALCPTEITPALTSLTDPRPASLILCVPDGRQAALFEILRTSTLSAKLFARVTPNACYSIHASNDKTVTLQTDFLRMLFHRKALTVQLSDEAALDVPTITHRIVSPQNCRYLKTKADVSFDAVASINGIAVSAASVMPEQAPFKAGLYAALLPTLSLCACGIDHAKQQLSVGLEIPEDFADCTAASVTALLLGLYRAQCELGIPSRALTVRRGAEIEQPSVSVFSLAHGKACASVFGAAEQFVYCLAPKIDANGIPNFASLRETMASLHASARYGRISSFRILQNETVADGLAAMSTTVTCALDETADTTTPHPLAILVACDRPMQSARLIGRTVPLEEMTKEPADAPVEVLTPSLTRTDRSEVVIVAEKTDADARMLMSACSAQGARVRCLAPEELTANARPLLTAQALLLCGNVSLPTDPPVAFAKEVLLRAGGHIFSILQKTPDKDAQILSDGISPTLLEQICRL